MQSVEIRNDRIYERMRSPWAAGLEREWIRDFIDDFVVVLVVQVDGCLVAICPWLFSFVLNNNNNNKCSVSTKSQSEDRYIIDFVVHCQNAEAKAPCTSTMIRRDMFLNGIQQTNRERLNKINHLRLFRTWTGVAPVCRVTHKGAGNHENSTKACTDISATIIYQYHGYPIWAQHLLRHT